MTTIDKQQLWWWRCNNGSATNSKQHSTNVQHAQRRTSNHGRMRWRMTAAEETWRMEQRTSKYGWWQRGNNNADDDYKKQQPTNVRRQVEDVCGGRSRGRQWLARGRVQLWRQRSDCCAAVEEKQLHDKAMEDGGKQQAGLCGVGGVLIIFSFLGGVESYLQSYPL
jgi:hypothetical protein